LRQAIAGNFDAALTNYINDKLMNSYTSKTSFWMFAFISKATFCSAPELKSTFCLILLLKTQI
jgi:hypothetical protein